jgi:hypothetical protein
MGLQKPENCQQLQVNATPEKKERPVIVWRSDRNWLE